MRLAAEAHDRMLLECAIVKARMQTCEDFMFDMDLVIPCSGAAAICQPRCIAV